MFKSGEIPLKNSSETKGWNDNSEFMSAKLIKNAQEKGYKIDHDNISQIQTFNPFEIPVK